MSEIGTEAGGRALREQAWRLGLERRAPRTGLRRVADSLLPRPRAVVVAAVAVVAMLPGIGVGIAMFQSGPAQLGPAERLSGALMLLGPSASLPGAALLAIAAALAGHPAPRAILLLLACLVLGMGAVGCGVGYSLGEHAIEGGPRTAAGAVGLTFGPLVLLLAVPAAGFAVWAPWRIWRDLQEERRRRLLDALLERGSVAVADLALAASATPAQVATLLGDLARERKLGTHLDPRHDRVFSARRLAGRQALLVQLVESRGRTTVPELASELDEPVTVVRSWVEDLRGAGHLAAAVEGDVLTLDPDGMGGAIGRSCGDCGGPMKAVGRGAFHCAYCGAEAFG